MNIQTVYYELRYKKWNKINPVNENLMIVLQPFTTKKFIDSEIDDSGIKREFYEATVKEGVEWEQIIRVLAPWADAGERVVLDLGGTMKPLSEVVEIKRAGKRRQKRKIEKIGKKELDFYLFI